MNIYKFRAILLINLILVVFFGFGQSKQLSNIAKNKTNYLKSLVKITAIQEKKIFSIYLKEAQKIDSLKYLPKSYFDDPNFGISAIKEIKFENEKFIFNSILTQKQVLEYKKALKEKQKQFFEKNKN